MGYIQELEETIVELIWLYANHRDWDNPFSVTDCLDHFETANHAYNNVQSRSTND